MGEYEYYIDQMFDALDDDIDDLFDTNGYRWCNRAPTIPTCNRCGMERLRWQEVTTPQGERWVLFEGKNRHVCKMSDNDFEDLTNDR